MKHALTSYIETERARGVSDDALREELLSKGWDSIAVHRALSGMEFKDEGVILSQKRELTKEEEQEKMVQRIASFGITLIGIAFFLFAIGSWAEFTPLERFLTILIPQIVLIVLAAYALRTKTLEFVGDSLEAITVLMVPFTVGAGLVQFKLLEPIFGTTEISPVVVATLTGLTCVVAHLVSAKGRGILQPIAAATAIAASVISISAANSQPQLWAAFAVTALFAVLLLLDYLESGKKEFARFRNLSGLAVAVQTVVASVLLGAIVRGYLEAYPFWASFVGAILPIKLVALAALATWYANRRNNTQSLHDSFTILIPVTCALPVFANSPYQNWVFALSAVYCLVLLVVSPRRSDLGVLPTLLTWAAFIFSGFQLIDEIIGMNVILVLFATGILAIVYALYASTRQRHEQRHIEFPVMITALVPGEKYNGTALASVDTKNMAGITQAVFVISVVGLALFTFVYSSFVSSEKNNRSIYSDVMLD